MPPRSTSARSPECEPIEDDDRIPTIGTYRGIGIQDHQSPERIELVKAAIDRVARTTDILELVDLAADPTQPPESRMFAASKVEIGYQIAAEERRNRPQVDLDRLRASVAGLDSVVWRSPFEYGSLFDRGGIEREQPLETWSERCSIAQQARLF
jgi:hypothetical protein